jgi:hypothetical protein
VANRDYFQSCFNQDFRDFSRSLAFPATRPNRSDGDYRLGGLNHGVLMSEQRERRSRRIDLRADVHDVLIRHVRVSKHTFVNI